MNTFSSFSAQSLDSHLKGLSKRFNYYMCYGVFVEKLVLTVRYSRSIGLKMGVTVPNLSNFVRNLEKDRCPELFLSLFSNSL